jgi:hypothetical protein
MGPRRTLQLSLIVAAAVAILIALTGVLSPAGAAAAGAQMVIWSR